MSVSLATDTKSESGIDFRGNGILSFNVASTNCCLISLFVDLLVARSFVQSFLRPLQLLLQVVVPILLILAGERYCCPPQFLP